MAPSWIEAQEGKIAVNDLANAVEGVGHGEGQGGNAGGEGGHFDGRLVGLGWKR